MGRMQRGYYGYRKRGFLPRMVTILLVVLIGAAGYLTWSHFFSGKDHEQVQQEVPTVPEEDLKASEVVASHDIASSDYWILVDKSSFNLYLYQGEKKTGAYPIATGSASGDKQIPGDNRTPLGTFQVESIENSSYWVYDFGDGKGPVEGAYGPWFIRLKTPWEGIGIHGTHDPSSIGTMCTAGCLRLKNSDLLALVEKIQVGGFVHIQE